MTEHYENYNPNDIRLPFRIILPDGTYAKVTDPKTLKEFVRVDRLTPGEVTKMKGLGYKVEQVEPKPDMTHINLSQPTGDKE